MCLQQKLETGLSEMIISRITDQNFSFCFRHVLSQPQLHVQSLTIETLEHGVKYV